MANFQEENIKRYPELSKIVQRLQAITDEITDTFNNKSKNNDWRRSKMPCHKNLLNYFLMTAIRQFDAISVLCSEGYGDCSLVILRSMLENLISLKYIVLGEKQIEERAERFENYKWVDMKKQLTYWKNSKGVVQKDTQEDILSKEAIILSSVEDFKKRFNINNEREFRTWSGISIEEMADRVNMSDAYNLMYRMCCLFSHPSFLGQQQGVTKNNDYTIFSTKPSFRNIEVNLMTAIHYLFEFLIIFDHLFNLCMLQKLKDFQLDAVRTFEKGTN